MPDKAEIVICGAGAAGLAAAYHLVVRNGMRGVMLVDERPPLSLTSAYGTEAYRNWWPDLDMFRFMDRSIDLMEELATETSWVWVWQSRPDSVVRRVMSPVMSVAVTVMF